MKDIQKIFKFTLPGKNEELSPKVEQEAYKELKSREAPDIANSEVETTTQIRYIHPIYGTVETTPEDPDARREENKDLQDII